MAQSIANTVQVSPVMAAQCVLVVAALTAQQYADVKPPYQSAKNKPGSLFIIVRAESGERKSAALKEAVVPIDQWQRKLTETYEDARLEYKRSISSYEKMVAKIENKAISFSDAQAEIKALGPEPLEPLSPSLILTEPTIDGLIKSAPISHVGRAIITDEAGAFLGG